MSEYDEFRKRFEKKERDRQQMMADLLSVAEQVQQSLIRKSGAPDHVVTFIPVAQTNRPNFLPVSTEIVAGFSITVSFGVDSYKAEAEFTVRHRGGTHVQISYEGIQGTVALPVSVGDPGVDFIVDTIWQKMRTAMELQF